MPEYLSPGVYVEEVPSGSRPIQGVGTSTAGFVGGTERGPTFPRLVTSWGDYVRWFGGLIDAGRSLLPHAVRGFFDNGGQRLFIARVVSGDAVDPAIPAGVEIPAPGPGADGDNFLLATAIGPGAWGNNLLLRIQAGTQADPLAVPPRDWFRLTVLYYRDGIPAPFVDPTLPANLSNPLRREPDVLEDFDNLTADEGRANSVVRVVNTASKLIQLAFVNAVNPVFAARPQDIPFPAPSFFDLPTGDADTLLRVWAAAPGPAGDNITVAVAVGTLANTFRIDLDDGANPEAFDNIPDGDPGQALAAVNGGSALARLQWVQANPPAPAPPSRPNGTAATNLAGGAGLTFAGGDDGAALNPADFDGDPALPPDQRTGLAGLEIIDEIALLAGPDEVNPNVNNNFLITNALVDQCERLRDRFAILAVPLGQGAVQTIRPPRDSTYGAVYYPWVRVVDPRTQDTLLIPPVGHVAGIYARTDVDRGVHKAPANEVVRGIVNRDLGPNQKPLEYQIVKGEHDILNPRGVNVIRDFRSDGRGIRVWGARTMSSDPLWRYINVRRLFLYVEESIDEGTQWVVFEPNDEPLWARVRLTISSFLLTVWRSGALQGRTADEAFFVRCDRTTMTQDDIDNGRLICEIGIAPVKPAEFVIFRIQQKTLEPQAS